VNIALWTVANILAFAFLAAGSIKLVRSRQQLVDAGAQRMGQVIATNASRRPRTTANRPGRP
jgi:hypothetical protein